MSESEEPSVDVPDMDEFRERHEKNLEEHLGQLDEESERALDALTGESRKHYSSHTINLTENIPGADSLEVEVIDTVPGRLEQRAAAARNGNISENIDAVIEMLCHVIQDDGYNNPDVWHALYEEEGSSILLEYVMKATEPYAQRQQRLADSRSFRSE